MTGSTGGERRACPTRTSGPQPLIVHSIGCDTCSERQRRGYHKCPTCAWRGLPAGATLPPEFATFVPRPAPLESPPAKKPAKEKAPSPVARPKISKAV